MLRSSGFAIESQPEDEVYVCRRFEIPLTHEGPRAVHPPRSPKDAAQLYPFAK